MKEAGLRAKMEKKGAVSTEKAKVGKKSEWKITMSAIKADFWEYPGQVSVNPFFRQERKSTLMTKRQKGS